MELDQIRERYPELQYRLLLPINQLPSPKFIEDEVAKIVYPNDNIATALSISVFVVVANLNSRVDMVKLYNSYITDKDKDGSFEIKYDPDSKKSKKTREEKMEDKKNGKRDSFYNCAQIITKIEGNNINIKVFPNGKLQIAGCQTMEVCHKVPKVAKNIVEYYSDCIVNKNEFYLCDQHIGMINSSFRFKFSLIKEKVQKLINDNTYHNGGNWKYATLQDKYEGIKAKYWMDETVEKYKHKDKVPKKVKGQVSVLIFGTGSVILTGAKTIEEISKAYFAIIKLIENNMKEVTIGYYDSDTDDDSDFEF